jgi:hypothetical protein
MTTSIMPRSIIRLSIMKLSIMTLRIIRLSIMTLSIVFCRMLCTNYHKSECLTACSVMVMLSVTLPCAVIMRVVMRTFAVLSPVYLVIILTEVMLSVILLVVMILSVLILSVLIKSMFLLTLLIIFLKLHHSKENQESYIIGETL